MVEQFRPGVMDRLGVGYDALRAANPRLIYCAITGYGQTGPYRDRAGHDLNFLALAGILSHTGRKDSGPPGMGVQVADVGGGSFGAITGILAAVIQRQLTGEGQMVDISMFDMALAWNSLAAAEYLARARTRATRAACSTAAALRHLPHARWPLPGRGEPGGQVLARLLPGHRPSRPGRSGLFGSRPGAAGLKAEIAAAIAQRSLAEWLAVFAPLDVCVEPVLTVEEALAHPQTAARGLVVDVPQPDGTMQQQVASPFRFSGSQAQYRHIGVPAGQDTNAVLAEIDYSAEEIPACANVESSSKPSCPSSCEAGTHPACVCKTARWVSAPKGRERRKCEPPERRNQPDDATATCHLPPATCHLPPATCTSVHLLFIPQKSDRTITLSSIQSQPTFPMTEGGVLLDWTLAWDSAPGSSRMMPIGK